MTVQTRIVNSREMQILNAFLVFLVIGLVIGLTTGCDKKVSLSQTAGHSDASHEQKHQDRLQNPPQEEPPGGGGNGDDSGGGAGRNGVGGGSGAGSAQGHGGGAGDGNGVGDGSDGSRISSIGSDGEGSPKGGDARSNSKRVRAGMRKAGIKLAGVIRLLKSLPLSEQTKLKGLVADLIAQQRDLSKTPGGPSAAEYAAMLARVEQLQGELENAHAGHVEAHSADQHTIDELKRELAEAREAFKELEAERRRVAEQADVAVGPDDGEEAVFLDSVITPPRSTDSEVAAREAELARLNAEKQRERARIIEEITKLKRYLQRGRDNLVPFFSTHNYGPLITGRRISPDRRIASNHQNNLDVLLTTKFMRCLLQHMEERTIEPDTAWKEQFKCNGRLGDKEVEVIYSLYVSDPRKDPQPFKYLIIDSIDGFYYDVGTGTHKSHKWAISLTTLAEKNAKPDVFRYVKPNGSIEEGIHFEKSPAEQEAEDIIEAKIVGLKGWMGATDKFKKKWPDPENSERQIITKIVSYGGVSLGNRQRNFSAEFIARCTKNLYQQVGQLLANGILHRDIKPENVLVNYAGDPPCPLVDFGASIMVTLDTGVVYSAGLNLTNQYSPFPLTSVEFPKVPRTVLNQLEAFTRKEEKFMEAAETSESRKVPISNKSKGVILEELAGNLASREPFEAIDAKFLGEYIDFYQLGYLTAYLLALHEDVDISIRQKLEKQLMALKLEENKSQKRAILGEIEQFLYNNVCIHYPKRAACINLVAKAAVMLNVATAKTKEPIKGQYSSEPSLWLAKLNLYLDCGLAAWNQDQVSQIWTAAKNHCMGKDRPERVKENLKKARAASFEWTDENVHKMIRNIQSLVRQNEWYDPPMAH